MAKRRSFSERVLGSDAYARLSYEVQSLYIALSMAADDEGMIGAPLRLARSIGAGEDALDTLARAGLIIRFPSDVCAVTHFHVNNYIPEGRRKATEYPAERALLILSDTGAYVLCDTQHANCMQNTCDTPAPLASPPSPPSSFSPCTPLSITPYNPPHHTPHPRSSSSGNARDACERMAREFWGRGLRKHERRSLLNLIARQAPPTEEDRDELLRYAFLASAEAGIHSISYLGGVYRNWEVRGIRTLDGYAEAEFERDKENGRL